MASRPPVRSYRRQRWVISAVAVAMVGLGVGVPLAQHLSQPAVDSGPPRPSSYQVVYRYGTTTGSSAQQQWEVLTVQRPFESSDLYYPLSSGPDGPAPASPPASGSLFSKDVLYSVDNAAPRAVAGRQPGPPGTDQDLITQLPEMQHRGEATDTGQSHTIAGRSCETWRMAGPPSGPIAVVKPGDHDDLCIDDDGLILSEAWTYKGQVVEQRQAVQVTTSHVSLPYPAAALQAAGDNTTLLGRGVPVSHPEQAAHTFVPTPPTPPGFTPAGEEGFVEPDPQNSQSLLAASLVWAFTDGPDIITVEAGSSQQPPWAQDDTRFDPVTLKGLGAGQSEIFSEGAEVHVALPDNDWGRIRGTIALAGLLRYADTLAPPTS